MLLPDWIRRRWRSDGCTKYSIVNRWIVNLWSIFFVGRLGHVLLTFIFTIIIILQAHFTVMIINKKICVQYCWKYIRNTQTISRKLYSYFWTIEERRQRVTEREPVGVPGMRIITSCCVFSSAVIRCFPYWRCSITSHKFLMSHSPVTFNCVGFLLPELSWWWWWVKVVATMGPGPGRVTGGRYYNESFVELWSTNTTTTTSHQWRVGTGTGYSPLSTITNNISYLENISMEFHCGITSGRDPNVNIYFHYLLKCYRKLSAQSKTQTRSGQLL